MERNLDRILDPGPVELTMIIRAKALEVAILGEIQRRVVARVDSRGATRPWDLYSSDLQGTVRSEHHFREITPTIHGAVREDRARMILTHIDRGGRPRQ